MLRVALALGLLVTPAAAEEYTQQDCETLDIMLNNCSDKPECKPVRSAYETRRFGALRQCDGAISV